MYSKAVLEAVLLQAMRASVRALTAFALPTDVISPCVGFFCALVGSRDAARALGFAHVHLDQHAVAHRRHRLILPRARSQGLASAPALECVRGLVHFDC